MEPLTAEIDDGQMFDEDFYENIEAPKFVDLTAPDRRLVDDDRYWFCARVGCDLKHEEEIDSEAIYKDFVLRVMAARSPSVRLRKVLCRKESSTNPKCPRTVPAKCSKSRVSRLAMISSILQKPVENAKLKSRQIISKQIATPNAKAKQLSGAPKALTAPRSNKNPLSNPRTFRSVRNPKTETSLVRKDRVVAKALVFHSPKKTVKLKRSVELSASMKKICVSMKKLEITNKANVLSYNRKPLHSERSRKQFKGREVKSRVFDSLLSQNQKHEKAKSPKSSKKQAKRKEESNTGPDPMARDESSDMEVDENFRSCSLEVCSTAGTSTSNKNNGYDALSSENSSYALSDVQKSEGANMNHEESDPKQKMKPSSEEKKGPATIKSDLNKVNQKEVAQIDDKENVSTVESNEKANAARAEGRKADEEEDVENDDKENALASDNNRKPMISADCFDKKKAVCKKETCKTTQKVTKVRSKTSNGRIDAYKRAQGVKYTKPKPTNPKPFRLRTDERGILKEANTEKKQLIVPAKQTAMNDVTPSKQQNTCQGKTSKDSATTPLRDDPSKCQKTKLEEASNLEGRTKTIKPPVRKQAMISPWVASDRKKRVAITAPSKQHVTVPKEPNFHRIHMPKSCTRRAA